VRNILLGDNTDRGGAVMAATDQVPVCWRFEFKLDTFLYTSILEHKCNQFQLAQNSTYA